jgi:uncharacterized protein (DUF885 family)
MPYILLAFFVLAASACPALAQQSGEAPADKLIADFVRDYNRLGISGLDFDYRENLRAIPGLRQLDERLEMVDRYRKQLKTLKPAGAREKGQARQLDFFLGLLEERFRLERGYRENPPEKIPQDGLYHLPDGQAWYRFYIRYWTGVEISPEDIMQYGLDEIRKIEENIGAIRERRGFGRDSAGWTRHLAGSDFFLTDEAAIRAAYDARQDTVLRHYSRLFELRDIRKITYRQWPEAGPFTPPGMYLSPENSTSGQPEFWYNFYGGRHNRRAMDWLYIHEAIPGHHFHWMVRYQAPYPDLLADLYFAAGTAEGWATYVEYFGKELGLYRDDYAELGKWEWDLVRSVRIVLSVGINYHGWSKEQARAFWRQHLPDQMDIADREIINRCTQWGGQVLSYKIGAKKIFELREAFAARPGFDLRKFHSRFLEAGMVPLEVMDAFIDG